MEHIKRTVSTVIIIASVVFSIPISMRAFAETPKVDFTGEWELDLRSGQEQKNNVECGRAYFYIEQKGEKITGNHVFATSGCGQLNEGFEGSVKGVVIGQTAVLVVTSGRNGAIVMGKAKRKDNKLYWETEEEIRPGEEEGDSPLIVFKGTFRLTEPE